MDALRAAMPGPDKAQEIFKKASSSFAMVLLVAVVVVLLFYVVVHMVRILKKSSLKATTVLKAPVKVNKDKNTVIGNPSSYDTINGKEYTYSMWVYVSEVESSSVDKHVFSRSGSTNMNPVFLMEGNSNKMVVGIRTNDSQQLDSTVSATNLRSNDYRVIEVDYIPIQRWVNIVLVVDNEFVTLFVDGEIHSAINMKVRPDGSPESRGGMRIPANTGGDISIGKQGNNPGIEGYMSKVQFFNYALAIDRVSQIYSMGPTSNSALSAIGLPLYGIRNPLYRIDTVTEVPEVAA